MKTERIIPARGLEGYCVTDTGKFIGKRNCQLVGSQVGGYIRYTVRVNKKTKSVNAARVVWESFYGLIPKGYEIDHINSDKSDNRLSNLRVVTHKENMANPITRARLSKPRKHYSVKYEKIR